MDGDGIRTVKSEGSPMPLEVKERLSGLLRQMPKYG